MAPRGLEMGGNTIPDMARKAVAASHQKKKKGGGGTVGASAEKMLEDLISDNLFFDSVVDMIPAKLYVKGQSGDDFNPKYFKGQAKESKEVRRALNKQAKRAKLDPSQAETTTQIKQRLEEQEDNEDDSEDDDDEEEENGTPKKPTTGQKKKKNRGKGPGVSAALLPKTPAEANLNPKKSGSEKEQTGNGGAASTVVAAAGNNASRIDALRAKLQAKIAEKRGQRPSDPSAVSKRAARAAEKKKRKEEAIARKKQKVHSQSEKANGADKKEYKIAENKKKQQEVDAAQDLATVDFGLLSGLNSSSSPFSKDNYLQNNKSLANLSKTKNLKKLLADAESKKQRLEELKNSALAEDQQKAANIHWGDAIKEATGERVKDDPSKLKKALKRKEVQKAKSSKAWKTRMAQTKSKMDDRQNIRNHNLNQRKVGGSAGANLSKTKIATTETAGEKGGKTKGRAGPHAGGGAGRAGFEGRKVGFINGNKPKPTGTTAASSKKKGQ